MGVGGRPTVPRDMLEHRQHATLLQSFRHRSCNGGDLVGVRSIRPIADHGIGIPCGVQATIFEPFARAAPSRQYGGLGLGLYIARQIVEALGGSIRVHSAPDQGTTFTVELPTEVRR